VLEPGRYTVEVTNLDAPTGSTRQATVLFAVELPGCSPEALTEVAGSGESVVLHLEVSAAARGRQDEARPADGVEPARRGESEAAAAGADGAKNVGKVRVMVQWRDDYQLAFSVRLNVRVELPDFECAGRASAAAVSLHTGRAGAHAAVSERGGGGGSSSAAGGQAGKAGKQGSKREVDDDMEKAIRLSLQTHEQETSLGTGVARSLRAVSQQHKLVEELVDISRYLVSHRRSLLAGGRVFARSGGEADSSNVAHALNRQLRMRLETLNRCIPRGAYNMMRTSVDVLELILAFAESECSILQTPHKVHYMLVVEICRVTNRTCAQAPQAADAAVDAGIHEVPYISSQMYEQRAHPTVTGGKGGSSADHALSSGSSGGRRDNALAESFVVVKDDVHEASAESALATAAGGSASSRGAPHGATSTSRPAKSRAGSDSAGSRGASSLFGVSWQQQKEALRKRSPFAAQLGAAWDCVSLVIKSHDDLRQDQLAADLLFLFDRAFKADKLELPLRPYSVLATCEDGGILETLTDALAIDTLKKRMAPMSNGGAPSFADCFEKIFGAKGSEGYSKAQKRFVASMAAYSVFCYVLHIKDRHNGNIMLCRDGAIAHIDFGIMLNVRYAKDVLELKIKLSSEFVQVIGDKMQEFDEACCKGFLSIRSHSRQLLQLLEMSAFSGGAGAALPCLERDALDEVKKRLKLECSDNDAQVHMRAELQKAKEHFSTGLLDQIHSWTHAHV